MMKPHNGFYFVLVLALCSLLQMLVQAAPSDTVDDSVADMGVVARLHIEGNIDRVQYRYLKRALESAAAAKVDTLIIHIDTDGGEVLYAREMLKLILDQPRLGRRTIAFVDFRAISAGALIAYGHQHLYISETATIGDIGVIFIKPGGEIEYAPEKIETVIRALLAQVAEQNGWNRAALLKMTARNQNLYRVTLNDGAVKYIIEDDLPEFLAQHPEIKKDDSKQVIIYRGKDRLLTLTGREAMKLNMASGLLPDLASVYAKYNIDPETVIDLSPNGVEVLAAYLAGWAPMLAGLALLFIVFELKTPGVGLWALLGAGCGLLFLIAQYALDMVNYLEVILLALGLALLAIEFLTMAGAGLIGASGAGLIFIGLVMAFLPNELPFDLSDERYRQALADAAQRSLLAIAILIVGVTAFIALVPRSRFGRRFAVQAEIKSTSVGVAEQAAVQLIGQRGISRESLHPGGMVNIAGQDHNARAQYGSFIDAEQTVEVVAVEFGELIVHAVDAEA